MALDQLAPDADRRATLRQAATGQVWLRAGADPIDVRLLDRSPAGFSVAYASGELTEGLEVEFVIGDARGRARVIWNRFAPQQWECGLHILPPVIA